MLFIHLEKSGFGYVIEFKVSRRLFFMFIIIKMSRILFWNKKNTLRIIHPKIWPIFKNTSP